MLAIRRMMAIRQILAVRRMLALLIVILIPTKAKTLKPTAKTLLATIRLNKAVEKTVDFLRAKTTTKNLMRTTKQVVVNLQLKSTL
jgi:hypothetical protein